jgi:hypothetical protein
MSHPNPSQSADVVGVLGGIEAADTFGPDPVASAYFTAARSLLDGARLPAIPDPGARWARALVCAFALEGLLKAYLAHRGHGNLKDQSIRHDLGALWALARSDGLALPHPDPAWLDTLSSHHGAPRFIFRYATGVNAVQLPAPEPMVSDLEAIAALIGPLVR